MASLVGKSHPLVGGTTDKSVGSASPVVRLRPLSKCVITLPKESAPPQWTLVKPIKSLDMSVPKTSDGSKKWSRLLNRDGIDHTDMKENDDTDNVGRCSLTEVLGGQFQNYNKELQRNKPVGSKKRSTKVKLPPLSKSITGTLKVYKKAASTGEPVKPVIKVQASSASEGQTSGSLISDSKTIVGQTTKLPVTVSNPEVSMGSKLRSGPTRGKISFLLDPQMSAHSTGRVGAQHGLLHGNDTNTQSVLRITCMEKHMHVF